MDSKDTRCSSCSLKFRPPFKLCSKSHLVCPHCRQHSDITTGEVVEIDDCSNTEKVFKFLLNSLLKDVKDFCQFDCGFRGKVFEMNEHENVCYKRGREMLCMIKNCGWYGTNSGIMKHVEEMHPEQLIVLSNIDDEFIVSFNQSAVLIAEYESDSDVNQIYWLQFYKENNSRFIVIKDHGTIGERVASQHKFTEYSISSISNDKYVTTNSVVEMDDESADYTKNGTYISCFKGDSYKVKIIRNTAVPLFDSLKENLECAICAEMLLGEIRQCPTGHSYCENCSERMKICPNCKLCIGTTRNFALEHLVADLSINCKYRKQGCLVRKRGKALEQHVKSCSYMETSCISPNCSWNGYYKDLSHHIADVHKGYTHDNPKIHVSHLTFRRVASNYFNFSSKLTETNLNFMVYHITNEKSTDFWFEVKFENSVEGHSISYCMPCRVATPEYLRNSGHTPNCFRIHQEIFQKYLCDDNQITSLVIFKKS